MEGTSVEIKLLNQFGKVVYQQDQQEVNHSLHKLEVNHLVNGLYLLQIKPENRRLISKKLIINRMY